MSNLIGFFTKFDSGQYFFQKRNINNLKENEKNIFRNKNIGFIHQFHYLIPELTTLENTILPLLINNNKFKDSVKIATNLLTEFANAA